MGSDIKVTDKRMFTAEGELRDEFRHLSEQGSAPAPEPSVEATRTPEPPRAESPPPAAPPRQAEEDLPRPERPPLELPGTPPEFAPTFYHLLEMLAEPVSLYLGDATLPDGGSAENLEMARIHIDLLDVVRQKTAGNLTAQEAAVLEDLLYRLRLRYVQVRG